MKSSDTKVILRTVIASMCFFFLMCSYYAIKPTRKPILLSEVNEDQAKYMISLFYGFGGLLTLAAVFLYNYLVSRFPRTQVLRIFVLGTTVVFMGFWLSFQKSVKIDDVAIKSLTPLHESIDHQKLLFDKVSPGSEWNQESFIKQLKVIRKKSQWIWHDAKAGKKYQINYVVVDRTDKLQIQRVSKSWFGSLYTSNIATLNLTDLTPLDKSATNQELVLEKIFSDTSDAKKLAEKGKNFTENIEASDDKQQWHWHDKEANLVYQINYLVADKTKSDSMAIKELNNPQWLSMVYFLFTSAYLLFLVSLFWSFNHDLNSPEESRRLYPYIFFGAQVGVIVGSQMVDFLKENFHLYDLFLFSAGGLVMYWGLLEVLKMFDPKLDDQKHAKPQTTGAMKDIKLFFSNPYVLGIGLLVVMATFVGTLFDQQFTDFFNREVIGWDAQTKVWSTINKYNGMCNIVMCLVITPLLIRFLGPGYAICLSPLTALIAGSVFIWGEMSVELAMIFIVMLNTFFYTLYQVGRELFYVPTDKVVRYKMKAFCDTFLFRFGDMASSWGAVPIYILIMGESASLFGVSYIALFAVLIWIPIILATSKGYEEKLKLQEREA